MSVEAVLDSNILLYAASKDPREASRAEVALGLLAAVNFGVPLQVAQEFFHNARVKARLAIEPDQCDKMIEALLKRPLVVTDTDLFKAARQLCRRFKISYCPGGLQTIGRRGALLRGPHSRPGLWRSQGGQPFSRRRLTSDEAVM